MDSVDNAILSCLMENSRMRTSEIAKKLSMSVSSISERIRRLERSGIIEQYTIKLNPAKTNRSFQVMIGISVEHPRYIDVLSAMLLEEPNVVECYTLTGDVDYMARVSATSPEHFQEIHRRIVKIEGIKAVKTYYILNTETNPRYNPLPRLP